MDRGQGSKTQQSTVKNEPESIAASFGAAIRRFVVLIGGTNGKTAPQMYVTRVQQALH
jgi:hypothetical protein